MRKGTPATLRLMGSLALVLAVAGVLSAVHVRRAASAAERVRPSAEARPAAAEACEALIEWNRAVLDAATTSDAAISAPTSLEAKKARFVTIIAAVERATSDLVQRLDATRTSYQAVAGVPEVLGFFHNAMSRSEQALQSLMTQAQALPVDTQANFDRAKEPIVAGVDAAGRAWSVSDLRLLASMDAASVLSTFDDDPSCAPIFHP